MSDPFDDPDSMQLRDLQQDWQRLDQRAAARLEKVEALAAALGRDRTEALTKRATWAPMLELLTTVVFAVLVAIALSRGGSAVLVGCSVFVLLFFAALMIAATWQIVALRSVDAAMPVVTTQRRLARVAAVRIFATRWTLLLSPVLWAPFLVVTVEAPLRTWFDVERGIFTANFVLMNLLVGGVLTGVLFVVTRRLAPRMRGTRFLANLLDDFAGRRLVAARQFLARLDGFER